MHAHRGGRKGLLNQAPAAHLIRTRAHPKDPQLLIDVEHCVQNAAPGATLEFHALKATPA